MAYYILYSDDLDGALLDTSSGVEPSAFHGLTNSVEITEDIYKYMLEAQCAGKIITFDSSCDFAVNNQECGECDCVKLNALQAKSLHMEDGDKWASVSHGTSTDATSDLCLDAGYGNGAASIRVMAAQQGGEITFGADYFTFTGGDISVNGKALSESYGKTLSTSDNKRIQLRATSAGLSNFDPAAIIANVIQGKGYGSTTAHGGVGAVGLFWTENKPTVGTTISGTSLKHVSLYLEDASGSVSTVKAEWWTTSASGTWVALCEVGSALAPDARNLILAVRTA